MPDVSTQPPEIRLRKPTTHTPNLRARHISTDSHASELSTVGNLRWCSRSPSAYVALAFFLRAGRVIRRGPREEGGEEVGRRSQGCESPDGRQTVNSNGGARQGNRRTHPDPSRARVSHLRGVNGNHPLALHHYAKAIAKTSTDTTGPQPPKTDERHVGQTRPRGRRSAHHGAPGRVAAFGYGRGPA